MEILPFSADNLAQALSNKYTLPDVIKEKKQFKYFFDYLTKLKAKRIIIEKRYISKDYLYDYTAYYSTCHKPYKKKCKRLHFFSNEFTPQEFDEALIGNEESQGTILCL